MGHSRLRLARQINSLFNFFALELFKTISSLIFTMSHPYQCLCHCPRASQFETGILVGASGSRIHTFSAQNGRYLSTWPSVEKSAQIQSIGRKSETDSKMSNLKGFPQDEVEPPTKRQKLSLVKNESSSSSAEIVVSGESDNDESSSLQQPLNPPVIRLTGTSNGQQVVAVTGEDKCIRVFDLAADGTLTQFSERQASLELLPFNTH